MVSLQKLEVRYNLKMQIIMLNRELKQLREENRELKEKVGIDS